MDVEPEKTGRMQDGTFAPGQSGNPGGKRPGTRHKTTRAIEALLEGQHEALTQVAIDKALTGDTAALRLCLDRLAPPRKDSPVSVALPSIRTARDAVEASGALLEALSVGDVTPGRGWPGHGAADGAQGAG